jgi:hypothetical protein
MYMCVLMFIPSFLVWQLIFVDNNRQQTPPSLPFARPRAKAKGWLLIRSCYYANYISNMHRLLQSFLLQFE